MHGVSEDLREGLCVGSDLSKEVTGGRWGGTGLDASRSYGVLWLLGGLRFHFKTI